MSTQIQYRRDTGANLVTFTGAAGEAVIDTDNKNWVIHDGSTPGGFAQASQAWVNAQIAALSAGAAVNILLAQTCT
jgi:hypothetical protein